MHLFSRDFKGKAIMLTNAFFNGTLSILDDPDLGIIGNGNIVTTGTIKSGTSITVGSFLQVTQYINSVSYVQASNCNFTSTTITNTFSGPLSLAATSPITSSSTASFVTINTTSTTASNVFAGPLTVQAAITGTSTLTLTNQLSCSYITTTSLTNVNTFGGLLAATNGVVSNLSADATTAGTGVKGALFGSITNIGGLSNYLSAYIGGRIVISTLAASVASNYITPNSNNGVFLHCTGQSWIDTVTAASSSATGNFNGAYFGIPSVGAVSTGVTTPLASTLTIAGAPSQGANQTITNAYSLFVQSGNVLFGGSADTNITNTAIAAVSISGGLAVSKSTSCAISYIMNTAQGSSGNAISIDYALTPLMVSGSRTETLIGQNLSVNNCGIINFNYAATNSTTNSIGLGLFGSNNRLTLNGAGQVSISTNTNATSTSTGAFVLAGGGGVALDWYVGGTAFLNRLNITSQINSTSTTTGALVAQSAGFAQDVYMGEAHSITRYYLTGYVNGNQNATINANVAVAVPIAIVSSSGTDMTSSLVSGNNTTVQFTAPYRANYAIALTLLCTPSQAGNCRLWTQITSSGIFNGTVRRGYSSRAITPGTQENLTSQYLGPLNVGDTVTWMVFYQPTGLISLLPSLGIAASTFSSLDISFTIRND